MGEIENKSKTSMHRSFKSKSLCGYSNLCFRSSNRLLTECLRMFFLCGQRKFYLLFEYLPKALSVELYSNSRSKRFKEFKCHIFVIFIFSFYNSHPTLPESLTSISSLPSKRPFSLQSFLTSSSSLSILLVKLIVKLSLN